MCLNIRLFWKKAKPVILFFLQLIEVQRLEQIGLLWGNLADHAWSRGTGLDNLQEIPANLN